MLHVTDQCRVQQVTYVYLHTTDYKTSSEHIKVLLKKSLSCHHAKKKKKKTALGHIHTHLPHHMKYMSGSKDHRPTSRVKHVITILGTPFIIS